MSTSKKKDVKKATCSDMNDTDLVEVHAKLGREKTPTDQTLYSGTTGFRFSFRMLDILLCHTTGTHH